MIIRNLHCSTTDRHRFLSRFTRGCDQSESSNHPEEDDESMSHTDFETAPPDTARTSPAPSPPPDPRTHSPSPKVLAGYADLCASMASHGQRSYSPYQRPRGLPAGYAPLTPYPSHAEGGMSTLEPHTEVWLHPSLSGGSSGGGFLSGTQPSYLVSGEGLSYDRDGFYSDSQSLLSLEQPRSLHSIPMAMPPHTYFQPFYSGPPPCCGRCQVGPGPPHAPPYPYWHSRPDNNRPPDPQFSQSERMPPCQRSRGTQSTTPLSLEQRKVFVTYESDSEEHVKEVINFVALLRHNGFYTHIDMFEQQVRSVSRIDFMERYISEKDYLIIIIISPQYHETVTNASLSSQSDETLNTVYIHKQLQNEFIQNGCRNFRFIPIMFPGAKKCHVPSWLQNTQIFSWPRGRDDILRRLMRVEKYNPPPIGELPTIVSIPL